MIEVFCSQLFVDRVEAAGLQGFVFIPIWPLPEGVAFYDEMSRFHQATKKWKPRNMAELDVKGNTVVLRLYCEKKKPSKAEMAAAEEISGRLTSALYDPSQDSAESYFGDVEGQDVVDNEIRIFMTAPDCDQLVSHLMPVFRALAWPGKFHVVKRRGEFVETDVQEEYVPLN